MTFNCSYCDKPIEVEAKDMTSALYVSIRCPHCGEVCPAVWDEEREEYKLLRDDDLD